LVEVKIDSFPYTKYGTIKGEVLHVSQDSADDEQLGLVYPARIQLAKQVIQAGSNLIRLSAGMTLTAEIKTGNRRIITYVLSPLQEYQSESLKER
jgi:RTX toxin transport system membrane fusion protein